MVRTWPRLPGRALTEEQGEQLLANPQTTNPLFLSVALEELRAGSTDVTVADYLQRLPVEGGLPALFDLFLHRLEEEFDAELVPIAMALLTCTAGACRKPNCAT